MTRLLGLDVGDRRVGVAVADEAQGTIRGLGVVRRGTVGEDAERVARIAAEQRADELVVGLPLDMSGAEGEQARRTRDWGSEIAARTGLPLSWRDERLTTEGAEAVQPRMRRDSTGRPTRSSIVARRARVDRLAAQAILRAELAAREGARNVPPESADGDTTGVCG
ncbi:MAG: Holliday junction resolvase RuvX [Chloroflexi bacterium]|nr:Holliday junction resolvase RuvX [Chloroflexota bacterium]